MDFCMELNRVTKCGSDTILDTEYLLSVDKGSTVRPHDNGIVAVIDGSKLSRVAFYKISFLIQA
jgi:hypothetical protein